MTIRIFFKKFHVEKTLEMPRFETTVFWLASSCASGVSNWCIAATFCPTQVLPSGQCSGGPPQLGAAAIKLLGTQCRLSQSLYALRLAVLTSYSNGLQCKLVCFSIQTVFEKYWTPCWYQNRPSSPKLPNRCLTVFYRGSPLMVFVGYRGHQSSSGPYEMLSKPVEAERIALCCCSQPK